MMELTADNVENTLMMVLAGDEKNPNGIRVDGIVNNYLLDREKLELHRENIADMVRQIPDDFQLDGGGGMTFLNLCMRNDGVQWTGFHWTQEKLYAMAAGLGMGKFLMPRNFWSAMPGNVPYIVFDPEGSFGDDAITPREGA